MKNLFYRLYAAIFNLCRIFPLKQNRVAFVAPHNGGEFDSLGILRSYVKEKKEFDIVFISTNDLKPNFSGVKAFVLSCLKAAGFFTLKAKQLATSKYIFLNDNFMPLSSLKFDKRAVITQLWHAEGAFKKFGLSAPLSEEIIKREKKCSEKFDYVICTSKNTVSIYAQAFGVDESKVLPLGSPRIDSLLNRNDVSEIRSEFDKKYPKCKNKKLILYAPTFRDDPNADRRILSNLDMGKFRKELGNDFCLLVKLHPQINSAHCVDGAIDVTNGHSINDLTLICDLLITDYSSVCMDFALLTKPCVFFAFDLDEYEKERSFYFDYKAYVPGAVAENFDEVLSAIKNPRTDEEKLRRFRDFNFDFIDTNNTERIFNAIISANPQ